MPASCCWPPTRREDPQEPCRGRRANLDPGVRQVVLHDPSASLAHWPVGSSRLEEFDPSLVAAHHHAAAADLSATEASTPLAPTIPSRLPAVAWDPAPDPAATSTRKPPRAPANGRELRLDCRACSVQRLPARLVTTPQTVHSFTRESSTGWQARSIRLRCWTCGAMSVPTRTGSRAWTGGRSQLESSREPSRGPRCSAGRSNARA
jgi:hypothetical protein